MNNDSSLTEHLFRLLVTFLEAGGGVVKSTEFHFFLPRRGHYELLRALSLLPFVDLDTKRNNVKGLR